MHWLLLQLNPMSPAHLVCTLPCRSSLSKLMKNRAGELEVNMLLYAIQKTTSFEKLLAQRFLTSKYMEKVFGKMGCGVCLVISLFLVPNCSELFWYQEWGERTFLQGTMPHRSFHRMGMPRCEVCTLLAHKSSRSASSIQKCSDVQPLTQCWAIGLRNMTFFLSSCLLSAPDAKESWEERRRRRRGRCWIRRWTGNGVCSFWNSVWW